MADSSIHPLTAVSPPPVTASERLLRAFRLHEMIHRVVELPPHLDMELTSIWEGLTAREKVEYAALCRCPATDNISPVRMDLRR